MVVFLGLFGSVLLAVFISVSQRNIDNAMDIIVADLQAGARSFEAAIGQRNEFLAISADALSADFPFKQVYASGDHSTILSAMENLLYRLLFADFMALVSDENRIIANTLDPQAQDVEPGWSYLIDEARRLDLEGEYPEAEDVVIIGNRPYHLTVLPFLNPDIEAWFAMGFEIDQFFTDEFKSTVAAEVTVIFRDETGRWQSNGSTLPGPYVEELLLDFSPAQVNPDETTMTTLGGEDFVTLAIPVAMSGNDVQVLLQRSLSEQLQPYQELQRVLLVIFALGLAVLLGGVMIVSRNVTRPVLELVQGAKRIEQGDYDEKVETGQKDELGRLAEAFNSMATGLAEKERVRDLLGKVVSREIADELMSKEIELGGEEAEVTVLFTDIRGFTSLSEDKSPQQLLTLLNEYFTALTSVIEANGGVVDKYIGDAVMALFGAPVRHEDAASRAVRTAMGMEEALDQVNAEYAARGAKPIHIGVGINTDEVVVGNMGTQTRLNYTAIGDGVNLASRVEGLTKHYGVTVIVTESTRNAATEFAYQELDLVRVKGKSEPVRIFRPVAETIVDKDLQQRLDEYHAFLLAYQKGDFATAKKALENYARDHSDHDHELVKLYTERLTTILASPPTEWDGVYTYESK